MVPAAARSLGIALLLVTGALVAIAPTASATPWPGPDPYGYTGFSIPYVWSSITGTGTLLPAVPTSGSTDDGYWGGLALNGGVGPTFTFSFYGTAYTTVYPSTNALLGFGAGSTDYTPDDFPNAAAPNAIVALYWADLHSDCAGSTLHHQTQGSASNRVFVVQYTNWYHLGDCSLTPLTMQLRLYEASACVEMVFNSVASDGSTVGIGLENAGGTQGLRHTYSTSATLSGTAVQICANAPPVTDAESDTINEDGMAHVDVLAGDADPEGNPLTLTAVGGGAKGVPMISSGHPGMPFPHVDYTANPDANTGGGPADTYTYTVNDGAVSKTQTNTVTIGAVNDPPAADPPGDVAMTEDDPSLTLAAWTANLVPGPATAIDEASQSIALSLDVPAPGVFSPAPAATAGGDLTLVPLPNQCTPAPVASALTLTDSGSGVAPSVNQATYAFSVEVACVNDPPVALDDAYEVPDNAMTVLDVRDNPTGDDYDLDTLVFPSEPMDIVDTALPAVFYGSVAVNGGAIEYTPPSMWTGETSFDYTVSDGLVEDTAHVDIVVGCPGLKAYPDSYILDEDGVLAVTAAEGLLANDAKPGGALDVLVSEPPTLGSVDVLDDGSFTYTPDADVFGVDSFTYRFKDTGYCNSKGVVTVTVMPLNDDPNAAPDVFTLAEDSEDALLDILANDGYLPDAPETLLVTGGSPVGVGELSILPNVAVYTPPPDWHGTTGFTYTISDGNGGTDGAAVQINVLNVNDAPHVRDDLYHVQPDETSSFSGDFGVLANDDEVDGEEMLAFVKQPPAHGQLTLYGDGAFTYTPYPGYAGPDAFLYYASDGTLVSAPAVADILVAENQPPVASFVADPPTSIAGNPVLFGDRSYDVDGEVVAWQWDFGDGAASTLPDPEHTFLAAGSYLVRLTVTDDDGAEAYASWATTITEQYLLGDGGAHAAAPPVADAGPDRIVVQGDRVELDGSGEDGAQAETWLWRQVDGPTAALSDPRSMRPAFTAPPVTDGPAVLVYELTIFDGQLWSAPDTVAVTVVPLATDLPRPQVVAGPDQEAAPGAVVTLEASATGFLPGSTVTYAWEQVLGPSVGSLPAGPRISFRAPAEGELAFTVTASDGAGQPVADSLRVLVLEEAGKGFTFERSHRPPGLVSFRSLVDGVQHRWDFGDGSQPSSGVQPVHAFTASGTYTVTHRVTLEDGSTQTYREPVTVFTGVRSAESEPAGSSPWALVAAAGAALVAAAVAVVLWRRGRSPEQ